MITSRFNIIEHIFSIHHLDCTLIRSHTDQIRQMCFSAGQTIQPFEDEQERMIYLSSGIVMASVDESDQRHSRHPMMVYFPGMWLGAKRAAEDFFHSISASEYETTAASDVVAISIEKPLLSRLMGTQQDFRDFVMRICVNETIRYAHLVLQMKFNNPVHRVVYGLSGLADAYLRVNGLYSNQKKDPEAKVSLTLTQSMVAELCGVSRSALSPILKSLKEHGWIDMAYGEITLCRALLWSRFSEIRNIRKTLNKSSLEEVCMLLNSFKRGVGLVDTSTSSSGTACSAVSSYPRERRKSATA